MAEGKLWKVMDGDIKDTNKEILSNKLGLHVLILLKNNIFNRKVNK